MMLSGGYFVSILSGNADNDFYGIVITIKIYC